MLIHHDGRQPARFDWFLRDVYQGTSDRLSHNQHIQSPFALHYFCPECGTVWAKSIPSESETQRIHHSIRMIPCDECCVLPSLHPSAQELNELPRPLLLRELHLAFRDPEGWRTYSRELIENRTS